MSLSDNTIQDAQSLFQTMKPLAGFAQRAGLVINGREKLRRSQGALQFILVGGDLSEKSRDEVLHTMKCPVYQALDAQMLEELFGMKNTKILGLKKNPLAANLEKCLTSCRIQ